MIQQNSRRGRVGVPDTWTHSLTSGYLVGFARLRYPQW
jgi:hypothetical protein